jgi:hypothetical protein
MPSPLHPQRLFGNLAALAVGVLVVAFGVDRLATWLGYETELFCTALYPVLMLAYMAGVLLTCMGIIIWAVSRFKSETGAGLAIGGVLLFIIPLVLPHYMGMSCPALPSILNHPAEPVATP